MMREFDLLQPDEPFDPFSVVLFKALQAIAFLFFIVLLTVAPQTSKGKVDSKAEFLISMSWPENHDDDFDLFVQDPLGNVAWYRRREIGFMVLERDDRGSANDFMLVNGEKVRSPTRQELVSVRGIVAGEFTVNVYHFSAHTGRKVPVTVSVDKLNPTVKQISKDVLQVEEGGAEKTAVRFTVDAKGDVTNVSRIPRSILETFYDPHRNGG